MAVNYAHRPMTDVALRYKPFNNVVSTDPLFEQGQNVMTDIRGMVTPFPGFNSAVENTPTVFKAVQNYYIWRRSNGNYVVMVSDLDTVAKVYKYEIGVDTSAVLLLTSASASPFGFVAFEGLGWCYFGNGTEMKKYNGATMLPWGMTAPANAPLFSAVAGSLNTYAGGYFYRTTGYRTTDGHESSASSASACTGNQTSKNYTVTWNPADYDSSADKVRIYRTTDGGSDDPLEMALVATVDKATATYTDSTADGNLSATTFAPAFFRNDPPPASTPGCSFGGRIYLFNGSKMYFTGREEIANGVAQDCVPGGLDGNNETWDGNITNIVPMANGVSVFTRRRIWGWFGSALDTMYPQMLLDRRGAVGQFAITAIGNSVAWLDTAAQVWLDGQEIGVDIRPDLVGIDQTRASLAVHISGQNHWLILCDGGNKKLFVYDLDAQRWFPPVTAGSAKFVYSGNTADNTVSCVIAKNGTKLLKMTPGSFLDDGADYSAFIKTNLFDMTPVQNPDDLGSPAHLSVETNATYPDTCKVLIDDDPDTATYTDISTNRQDAPMRNQGTNLKESWFMASPQDGVTAGRRVSYYLGWNKCSTNWALYGIDPAFQPNRVKP